MKLSSCTLVLATLCTLSHGTFVLLQEDLKEEFRAVGGLKSYRSYPRTIQSLSETDLIRDVDEKSLSRRRAELTLSQECIDGTKRMWLEDIRYDTTFASVASSCPVRNTNQDGTVAFVADRRDCDQSAFLAFCDANYQSVQFPNVKVTCAPNPADIQPAPRLIYAYDFVECVDPSCPSDSELSPEDVLEFLFLRGDNTTTCVTEFLEEGEEPTVDLADAIVPDNLSEECIDQIDALSTLRAADEEWVNITISEPECRNAPKFQWMSGNDTFIVRDRDIICDEGQENNAKRKAYCEAQPNYQFLEFGTMKVTCVGLSSNGAGNVFVYYAQFPRCKGLSCPANPADWSILDIKYTNTPGTLESCEWELIGLEDIPDPPEDDATAAPENKNPAPLDGESSASGFVAGMTITLPLAAAFFLLA